MSMNQTRFWSIDVELAVKDIKRMAYSAAVKPCSHLAPPCKTPSACRICIRCPPHTTAAGRLRDNAIDLVAKMWIT